MHPDERDLDQLYVMARYCRRALDDIERFGHDYEVFCHDSAYQDATALCLIQIGEATHRLGDEFKEAHPEVAWADIYGMRNHLVHGYDAFDPEIAWDALTRYVPDLLAFCQRWM